MPRKLIATVGGVSFFVAYLILAATLGSMLRGGVEQLLFFALAGVAWFPVVRWIMLWSVGK